MKVFLSSLEHAPMCEPTVRKMPYFFWNLMSYWYIRKNEQWKIQMVIDKSEEIMIDSGAHSIQTGSQTDIDKFTEEYAKWIEANDCNTIRGYFEMDVDTRLGYDKVLELREILKPVAGEKLIPVWHKNRGVEKFVEMCEEYSGSTVAISGFRDDDIRADQYPLFLKKAWEHDCTLFCLGMTRTKIMDKVPFDFCDSSSWKQQAIYMKVGGQSVREKYNGNYEKVCYLNYIKGMEKQLEYYRRWFDQTNDDVVPENVKKGIPEPTEPIL